jgi:hypothetical protein
MFLSDPSLRRSADTRRLKKAGRAVCVPLTAWGVLAKIGHFVGGFMWMQHVTAMQHYDWLATQSSGYLLETGRSLTHPMKNYQMHQHDTMMPDEAGHNPHSKQRMQARLRNSYCPDARLPSHIHTQLVPRAYSYVLSSD